MKRNRLEERLLHDVQEGKDFLLEDVLIALSGISSKKELAKYKTKLNKLQKGFHDYSVGLAFNKDCPLENAELLFNYLWDGKSERYSDGFFLSDAIDAQLDGENTAVGNCVGLTALYSVLCLREDIPIETGKSDGHVFSVFRCDEYKRAIQNTRKNGFGSVTKDADGNVEIIRVRPLTTLIYDTLVSRADKLAEINPEKAMSGVDMAISICRDEDAAYSMKGLLLQNSNRYEESIEEFDKAIFLDTTNPKAYYNRGLSHFHTKEFALAKKDFNDALRLDRKLAIAYVMRGIIRYWQDNGAKKALADFNRAIKLDPDCEDAWYNRAAVFIATKQYDKAAHDLCRLSSNSLGRVEIQNLLDLYQNM